MSPRALGAHDGQHGAGDVHRAEQVGLDLCPEVLGGDLLEEPGVEVAGVVDEHVDAAEPLDGGLHGRLGVLGAGDVELDDEQVVGLADRLRPRRRCCGRSRRPRGRRRAPPSRCRRPCHGRRRSRTRPSCQSCWCTSFCWNPVDLSDDSDVGVTASVYEPHEQPDPSNHRPSPV